MTTYKGACFCGTVTLECTGAPSRMGYCHCRSCRSWSAGPVNGFTIWAPDQVKITGGAEHLGTFAKTPRSERQWCKLCGGHVMTVHPAGPYIDVYAATIPDLPFVPSMHVHYAETVLPMKDGLPKFSAGGGSALVAEG